MTLNRIIVLTGPTGSGKSERAVSLAETLNGEIVSADSVAVYRDFNIGSAKPRAELLKRVPHHLVSLLDPKEDFSAGRFIEEADRAIGDIVSRRRVPIIVGGTGLYIRALLHGLIDGDRAELPNTPGVSNDGVSSYEKLREVDPQSASVIHPSDRSRIKRALEYFLKTGVSVKEAREQHRHRRVRYSALVLVHTLAREALYARIDERVRDMLDEGLLEETKALLLRYPRSAKPFGAIGYRHAVDYLESKRQDPLELGKEIARDTRRFAKRQLTWWRNEPAKLGWSLCQEGGSDLLPLFLERSSQFKQDAVYLINQMK